MTKPRRGIRAGVASGSDVGTAETQDRLLDVREAATLLGLQPATLYQWAYKRRIPVVKLFGPRGALRFRLRDVEQLIQDSLRPAMGPPERKGGSEGKPFNVNRPQESE